MVTDPDWDQKDEIYFFLAPYFGWGAGDLIKLDDFPVSRAYRYTDKIHTKLKDPKQMLSLREEEVYRAIGRSFGGGS